MATMVNQPLHYTVIRVGNRNQPEGKVKKAARLMYIEQPFLPKQIMAKALGVTVGRVYQVVRGLEKERGVAQKKALKQLKDQYLT